MVTLNRPPKVNERANTDLLEIPFKGISKKKSTEIVLAYRAPVYWAYVKVCECSPNCRPPIICTGDIRY